MSFEIVLAPEAIEDYKRLRARVWAEIRAALEAHPRHAPEKLSRSRIKLLRGLRWPQYRLRVGDIRLFYDLTDTSVQVLAIVSKQAAGAWFSRFANPE